LSNIPANATIVSASLFLYVGGGVPSLGNTNETAIRRLLRNWSLTTVDQDEYSAGNLWTTPGGEGDGTDRIATPSVTGTPGQNGIWFEFTSAAFKAEVQGMVDGTYPKYGWHASKVPDANDNNGSFYDYSSSSHVALGTDKRPYLAISYTTPPDVIPPTLSAQTINAITHQGGRPQVTTDEAGGTAYMVVVPNGDTPSTAQIKAGQNSIGGAALYAENKTGIVVGAINFGLVVELAQSTAYDVWFVHTDAASNDSTPVKYDLTTLAQTISKNNTFEFAIRHTAAYPNKLTDVTLNVTYTPPVAAAIPFWGFFDGDGIGGGAYNSGDVWKFRCLGFEPGTWNYAWQFSDLSASGSGSFTVTDDAGNIAGKVKAYATNPHWFERDGAPIYLKSFNFKTIGILGQDIAWVSANIYQKVLDAGYNHVLQTGLLPTYYAGNPQVDNTYITDGPAGLTGQLWLDSNISQTWRLDWMKSVEDHLRWHSDRGVMVQMFWGFDGNNGTTSRWGDLTSGEKDWYVRYIVSRLAPYAGMAVYDFTWEPDDFGIMAQGFELMDRLITYDKFGTLHGIFEGGWNPNSYNDSRNDLAMWESNPSLGSDPVILVASHNEAAIGSYYSKPLFAQEGTGLYRIWLVNIYGYSEAQADDLYARCAWATVMGGSSFTWEDHCGLTLTSLNVYGRSVPIARIGYLSSIMSTEVEWWKMMPNNGLLSSFTGNAYCLAEVGQQYLAYRDSNGVFGLTIANGMAWLGEWIDTRTNTRSSAGSGTGGGTPVTFTPPASPTTEWVLKVVLNGVFLDASPTQAGDTVAATASAQVAMDANSAQQGDTISAAASIDVALDASPTQAGDTVAATASAQVAIDANSVQQGDTISATISTTGAAVLDADITQQGDTANASASAQVALDANSAQQGDTISAAASIDVALDASPTQAGDTVAATASAQVALDANGTQQGDTLTATIHNAGAAVLDADITQQGDTVTAVIVPFVIGSFFASAYTEARIAKSNNAAKISPRHNSMRIKNG
jgi:hypothetical protein